jgi:hypothetical protein
VAQISETSSRDTQLSGALHDGQQILDLNQEVKFQAYTRIVLPLDGYVFWSPTVPFVAKGSLHYAQSIQQNETDTLGLADVTFSSLNQIVEFTSIPPNTIYVASAGGFRYAFSAHQGFYRQANLWHYHGHSIEPAMASQLLDEPAAIDPNQAVVSNSLPLWLALNNYGTMYADWFSNSIPVYPSFLTEMNLAPPYAAVHISNTTSNQLAPVLTSNRSHYQLATDQVRVTLYGLQNNAALDFLDCVLQYSVNTDNFGIMGMPIVTDGKRVQTELQAIGMQKFIDFSISYNQARVADVARQLILSAVPTIIAGSVTVI